MKRIVTKYISLSASFFIGINLIVYFYTIYSEAQLSVFLNDIYFFEILPYIFGLFCGVLMIIDESKSKYKLIGNHLLLVIIILSTIMDYFSGIIFFTIIVLANNRINDNDVDSMDDISEHLVVSKNNN